MITLGRTYPLTLAALAAAVGVCLVFAGMVHFNTRDGFPNWGKPFLMPGMLPFYVAGVVTGSQLLSLLAFAIGTTVVYGSCGLILDGIWKCVMHRISHGSRPSAKLSRSVNKRDPGRL